MHRQWQDMSTMISVQSGLDGMYAYTLLYYIHHSGTPSHTCVHVTPIKDKIVGPDVHRGIQTSELTCAHNTIARILQTAIVRAEFSCFHSDELCIIATRGHAHRHHAVHESWRGWGHSSLDAPPPFVPLPPTQRQQCRGDQDQGQSLLFQRGEQKAPLSHSQYRQWGEFS